MGFVPVAMSLRVWLSQDRPQSMSAAWMQRNRNRLEHTKGLNLAHGVSASQFLGWYMRLRSVERLLTCHGALPGGHRSDRTCVMHPDAGHQNARSHAPC